ncbi:Copper amine oxidase N-terminal domain-containing protein [Paenibacillus sp. UNCCL117]|uniref:esterase-like activity of phytase family protein n=1 Tax=unclassified Paenibacillus TaxID=185978 RepID=UPI00088105E8|nr:MULTISPECIES: esterase-like activity of phytase family protein [unclassified Paenibacillus]SDD16938.1 Copper amine oxidase N-terminal domain-containing protein [Paenibacillus sp. cl123]SFW34849.1 Copper amine oxidase N-terminal domain-containing protein [Paenibacillus sp. UNCCL117]
MTSKTMIGALSAILLAGAAFQEPASAATQEKSAVVADQVQYSLNGTAVKPALPAVNVEGSLFLPVRAFGQLLNKYVDWDAATQSVLLTDKPELIGKYELNAPDLADGIKMSVGSSLTHLPGDPDNVFYSTADRGPNGEVPVDGEVRRTFPLSSYTPSIYKIQVDKGEIKILETIPLKVNGVDPVSQTANITGLSNVASRDEKPYDKEAKTLLSYDPYGLDIEGIAYNAKDDTFWISEEYGPSIVQVKRDGTIIQRIVPAGMKELLDSPAVPLVDTIPAAYLNRRSNRGMEAVGITPDGKWMFAAMQSPLRNPDKKTDNSRVLRILKFDLSTLKPVAEYAYVSEDAGQFQKLAQADIVISDLIAVNETTLLVDERDKNAGEAAQLKRIYLTDLSEATNVLGKYDDAQAADKTLEQMSMDELAQQSIRFPAKRTVLDAVEFGFPFEKIEGISLVNGNVLSILNDNDFGVAGDVGPGNGTLLWQFKLPYSIK